MIKNSFNRLGLLVQQAIFDTLRQELYMVAYRKLIREYISNSSDMAFQVGRVKVTDTFPCISIEAASRKDSWAAVSFTKDLEFRFDITVAVKVASGQEKIAEGLLNQTEAFVITLAEYVQEILNEPINALQYELVDDQDGKALTQPLAIYDSLADGIQYGYLYNGALRSARVSWFGKIMRVGPTGGPYPPVSIGG